MSLFSGIGAEESNHVLIIDGMGLLAEFYGCADLALVGGGIHNRVHNVLEPAVRGLYLSYGPRYHTSKEAIGLVNDDLVTVVDSDAKLLELLDGKI